MENETGLNYESVNDKKNNSLVLLILMWCIIGVIAAGAVTYIVVFIHLWCKNFIFKICLESKLETTTKPDTIIMEIYEDTNFKEFYSETCCICLEQQNLDTVLIKCGHFFHKKCINKWIEQKRTCPNCNLNL